MSKDTFRAADDLIGQLEEFDVSKSEVVREALREFLDEPSVSVADATTPIAADDSLDELVAEDYVLHDPSMPEDAGMLPMLVQVGAVPEDQLRPKMPADDQIGG